MTPDPDFEASSLSLYIGIPTQGFRSVQAEISGLVGQILTVGHKCKDAPSEPPQYSPLVQGASSYISVFGYWMGGEMASRRVDDHTEVIEFLFPPQDLGAVTTLVFAEVVFPAMFAARQDVVLATVNHQGMLYRISASRTSQPDIPPRGPEIPKELAPHDMLLHLLNVCVSGWLGARRSGNKPDKLDHRPLFDEILTSYWQWCKAESPPLAPGTIEKEPRLPTIRHRLLILTATWWLLNDLGPSELQWEPSEPPSTRGDLPNLSPRRDPIALRSAPGGELKPQERNDEGYSLYLKLREDLTTAGKGSQVISGYLLLALIDEELERTIDRWDKMKRWFAKGRPGTHLYGADPLANSLLWLAYTGDWLEYYLGEEHRPSPLRGRSGPSPVPSDRFSWILEKVAPKEATVHVAEPSRLKNWDFWTQRLNVLAQVNDANFPDQPLLSAWRLLARMLPVPWTRAGAHSQRNRGRMLKSDGTVNLDWWTDIARMWSAAAPAARMWLSPLMLDRIHAAISGDKRLRGAYGSFLRGGGAKGPAWSLAGLLRHFRQLAHGEPAGIDSFAALIDSARFGIPITLSEPKPPKRTDPGVFFHLVQGK